MVRIQKYPLLLPAILCGCSMWLVSCSLFPNAGEQSVPSEDQPEDRVIRNLTSALAQIFDPAMLTTVQVNHGEVDPMTRKVAKGLLDEGFGVQMVSGDQGINPLTVEIGSLANTNGEVIRYTIGVGSVSVGRSYSINDEGAYGPVTKLAVAGTLTNVVVDDSMFQDLETDKNIQASVRTVLPAASDEPNPVISLITPEIVARVAKATTSEGNENAASFQALNTKRQQVSNLFYSSETNFASAFDSHELDESLRIIFANDSLVLGETYKGVISNFVSTLDERTDLVSVVGCSNGYTALEIGNEGLAMGRASRVSEELVLLGVPEKNIFDEGCWAGTSAGKAFPARGVILEKWSRTY